MQNLELQPAELKIGIGKGRGFVESLDVFDFPECESRREFATSIVPVFHDATKRVVCVQARQGDLVWMLKNRHIDVAVGSSIWFAEQHDESLEIKTALEIKPCRLSLIAKKQLEKPEIRRVCSRFPATTQAYLDKQGMDVEIVPMQGCHEIALALEIADAIVDVIETGRTLERLELFELDTILKMQHQIWIRKQCVQTERSLEGCLRKARPRSRQANRTR